MKALYLILSLLLFASCASRNDVVSRNFIQKRKYNKGFILTLKGNQKRKHLLVENKIKDNKDLAIGRVDELKNEGQLYVDKQYYELKKVQIQPELKPKSENKKVKANKVWAIKEDELLFASLDNQPSINEVFLKSNNENLDRGSIKDRKKTLAVNLLIIGFILLAIGVAAIFVGFVSFLIGDLFFLVDIGLVVLLSGLATVVVGLILSLIVGLEKPFSKMVKKDKNANK